MKSLLALILACMVLGISNVAFSTEKIGSRLAAALATSSENDQIMAWVFFTDKGSHEYLRDAVPMNVVSERSLQRRRKVRAENELVDYTDLPVEQAYIDQLAQHVLWVKQHTKWFNGASVVATKAQIQELESLPFVSNLDLVYRAKVNRELEQEVSAPPDDSPIQNGGGNQIYVLNYGASFRQDSMLNVPAVHNTGNYAQGVIVGSFDNGYRLLTHQAFDTLRPRIIATYDYVDHKVSVVPNDPSTGTGAHGINTLSTMAGYRDGQLIGPAWGATFILARTENDSSETPIEEDNWAAAIEWADSIGVEVTSTSLGYNTYDPPYTSWTWEDMNGNTTLITRAADWAVSRGIVVCNSAGNSNYDPNHNTLGAPADGDSVVTVGAVGPTGTISSFSSCGPTTSVPPLIKPDVCAQGSSVRFASATNPTGYTSGSGTSFSCPLTAGVAALIIKARPNATPVQIANAMRSTANRASTPDNRYGWGIVNALAAINALGPNVVSEPNVHPTDYHLEQNYPNPFNPSTSINYSLPEDALVTVKVYDALGREVKTLISSQQAAESYRIVWNGTDASGRTVASGMYLYRLVATNASGKVFADSKRMILLK
jgi:subtilisin family serine protease